MTRRPSRGSGPSGFLVCGQGRGREEGRPKSGQLGTPSTCTLPSGWLECSAEVGNSLKDLSFGLSHALSQELSPCRSRSVMRGAEGTCLASSVREASTEEDERGIGAPIPCATSEFLSGDM